MDRFASPTDASAAVPRTAPVAGLIVSNVRLPSAGTSSPSMSRRSSCHMSGNYPLTLGESNSQLAGAHGGHCAAVDEQVDAGDEAGLRAQEELGRGGDVVGCSEAGGARCVHHAAHE